MSDPVRPDDIRLRIWEAQIAYYRDEVKANYESQRSIFRYVIVGVAGVIALRKDLTWDDLRTALPLMPVLAMIFIAYWLWEFGLMYTVGRRIAGFETRINRLLKEDVLSHEIRLLATRRQMLGRSWWMYSVTAVLLSICYYAIVENLRRTAEIWSDKSVGPSLYFIAVLANAVATIALVRMRLQLRPDDQFRPEDRADEEAQTMKP